MLAARLSEDPDRRVLLIEAGAAGPQPVPAPAHILPIGPGAARARTYATTLREGVRGELVRGVGLGGSGAVNGCYFIRATPADLDGWGRAAHGSGTDWSYAAALPYFRRSERDLDYGSGPVHGDAGPVPVARRTAEAWRPVTTRFMAATGAAGFPEEPDKNAGGAGGAGPVPCNIREGMRADPASTYLGAARGRPNLTVLTGATVDRILLRSDAVQGVAVRAGGEESAVHAPTVVLSAGAIESPALLWRTGIGDPGVLGRGAVHPLPAVGREFSDHPEITIPYVAAEGLDGGRRAPAPLLEACLHAGDGQGGEVEIRPYTASFGTAVPGNPPMPPVLGVALMTPRGRGRMSPHNGDPHGAPVIEHHYLTDPRDRAAARSAVDLARGLLDASGIGTAIDGGRQLGSSQHLAGTCPMGPDPLTSVVDGRLRVHGIDGLSIADLSVFPRVPSRGPHATAVMLAERAADFLSVGR